MDRKKYLIIYHNEDNDGLFSAALFYDYLTNDLKIKLEDICFLGANYNMLETFAKENTVEKLHEDFENIIMTDISFNDPKYMKKIFKEFGNQFTWCDHHAPIIKASFEYKFYDALGVRDTNRSAILNVWKFLYDPFDEAYNEKKVPELLRILSAWDSWSYEREGYDFEYVRDVNKGVTNTYDLDLGSIKSLIGIIRKCYDDDLDLTKDRMIIDDMYNTGHIINTYDDKVMENIIKTSGDTSWKIMTGMVGDNPTWRPACAIFHQGASNSTMFKSVIDTCANGIVFKHEKNGNWVVSLYNIDSEGKHWNNDYFHCGDFMKEHYKGGGHPGAAGCTLTQKQFIKILKNKSLG